MGSSNTKDNLFSQDCMICGENQYLRTFVLGVEEWSVCTNCVEYGLIMLINKMKPKK